MLLLLLRLIEKRDSSTPCRPLVLLLVLWLLVLLLLLWLPLALGGRLL